ncbi:MAG: hypothetical protein JSW20_13310 [Nitrospiraceae bacterium]|nr:MAG: hypothetical protein JSW20_13310 [Nitrospiraceae bacterium]
MYKIVFLREEKFRLKNRKGFYFEEYLRNPKDFESNLYTYLPFINILVHSSYWDFKYTSLVTKKMLHRITKHDQFRLEFTGDLSCDIKGSIKITHKTTSRDKPVFTYNPILKKYTDGYRSKGITDLAVDNLPAEMPGGASDDFSRLIREYVYQITAHGTNDITKHLAIPAEIRKAVVTQNGRLTGYSSYLKKYL